MFMSTDRKKIHYDENKSLGGVLDELFSFSSRGSDNHLIESKTIARKMKAS